MVSLLMRRAHHASQVNIVFAPGLSVLAKLNVRQFCLACGIVIYYFQLRELSLYPMNVRHGVTVRKDERLNERICFVRIFYVYFSMADKEWCRADSETRAHNGIQFRYCFL